MGFRDTYQLGLYEKAIPDEVGWEERLNITRESGFDFLEMSIDVTESRLHRLNWRLEEIQRIRYLQEKTGIFIESMCLSAQRRYPLGSQRQEEHAKELLRSAVVFAKRMGIRYIMLQGYDCCGDEKSDESSWMRYYKNMKAGARYAASQGVMLAVETMETPFMNTIEKAMRSIRHIDSPYLLVYPDLGNITNGAENILEDIESGVGHIAAVHLKETLPGKFREVPFGAGNVNFPAGIAKFYEQGVQRYVAEFWHCGEGDWREGLIRNREFLEEQFRKAKDLLEI